MKILILVVAVLVVGVLLAIAQITQPTLRRTKSSAEIPADADRLQADVRKLSEDFVPRDFRHPENLDAAAAWIDEELQAAGGTVTRQHWTVHGVDFQNVVASFGPETDERIVVGAHYDAFDPLPGADDNASGIAGLLEVGRLLGATKLSRRVELVAFTLEEPPYFRTAEMGSARHAAALADAGTPVRAMICLEMIGYFSEQPHSQSFPTPLLKPLYPRRGDFIAVVGRLGKGGLVRDVKAAFRGASDLPVRSINGPAALPGVDFSDHMNYWARGYDAVMITDTALYRNPAYHTAHDTADRLDYPRMAKVVDGTFNAVLHLAQN